MNLYFDTETSDMIKWKEPSDSDTQPTILQLAWILETLEGEIINEASHLIHHHGFPISPEASAVHGLTKHLCESEGAQIADVLQPFAEDFRSAAKIICHNTAFDMRMLRIVTKRNPNLPLTLSEIEAAPAYCTMKATTPICKLPSPRSSGFKWPTLMEAYQILVSPEGFEDAHDALADVRACRAIYHAIQENSKA